MSRPPRPEWTTLEVRLLRQHYPQGGSAAVKAAGVSRGNRAIAAKAAALNITTTFHWRREL